MSGFFHALLPLAPLLLLVISLLFGRYPGCDTIVRLAERLAHRSWRGSRSPRVPRPTGHLSATVTGGLLIAFGLARRPPPLAA